MISSGQVTVGTAPVEVSSHHVQHVKLTLHSHEHASGKRIWVGPANVTTSTGMLLNGEILTLNLNPMEHLHAITDSGTALLGYVRQTS